jgi:hypothetical protein
MRGTGGERGPAGLPLRTIGGTVAALLLTLSAWVSGAMIPQSAPAFADASYSAAADFSATSNPTGVWSYGWSAQRGSAFTLDTQRTNVGGADIWFEPRGDPVAPGVFHNGTNGTVNPYGTHPFAPGQLGLHPGPYGDNAVVRWTAPAFGTFDIAATFSGMDTGGTTTDVAVLRNGGELFSGLVNGYQATRSFSGVVAVSAGETIDFSVGYGSNETYFGDMTGLDAVITEVPFASWQGRPWLVNSSANVGLDQADDSVTMTIDPAKIGTTQSEGGSYSADCTFAGDFTIRVEYTLLSYPIPTGVRVGILANGLDGTASAMERVDGGYIQDTPGWPYHNGHASTASSGTLQLSRSAGSWTTYLADATTGGQLIPFDQTPAYGDASVWPTFGVWSSSLYYTGAFVKVAFSNFRIVDGTCAPSHADTTPPTISGSAAPPANANGWNDTPVTVSFACSDAGSGIASCTSPTTLSDEGATQSVTGTATDNAGNSASATVGPIRIDLTSPSITGVTDPPPNANGWNASDVTVHWNCTDLLSGIDGDCPSDALITGEGSNLTASASVADRAGNEAGGSVHVKIDRTAPVTIATAPGGWNSADVTVAFDASDNLSGVDATRFVLDGGAPQSGTTVQIAGDGDHTLEFWSVDRAGNEEAHRMVHVLIDETVPLISHTQAPPANGNGWNRGDVTVTFVCSDDRSGIASCTGPSTLTGEGLNQTVTGTAIDNAGNQATDVASVNIDRAPPSISGAATTNPNGAGWYAAPVTVAFTCADDLSGVATCAGTTTLSSDGAGRSVDGTATDAAGNQASATVSGIDIDQTAPTVTITAPANGSTYDVGQTVAAAYGCSDALSGIDTCSGTVPSGASIDTTTAGTKSFVVSAVDRAGNTTTRTVTYAVASSSRATTTTVTSSANPSVLGAAVTFTATVSASSGTPAGTVQWQIDGTNAGAPVALDANGKATYSTSALMLTNGSPHTIAANYAGGSGFLASSGSLGQSVAYASTDSCLGSPGHQILQPINEDGSSVFKAKSTVVAKFRVCDANGASIGTSGVVTSFRLTQTINGTVVLDVDEDVNSNTPDSAFRWDPGDRLWIFNISTKGMSTGYTYVYTISLNDGSRIVFQFGLR